MLLLNLSFVRKGLPDKPWRLHRLCAAFVLIELILLPNLRTFLVDAVIGSAYAYKVQRVCEKVTTKSGTSEKCKTKLVKPGEEPVAGKPPDDPHGSATPPADPHGAAKPKH